MYSNSRDIEDLRIFVINLSNSFNVEVESKMNATFLGSQSEEARLVRQTIEGYLNYYGRVLVPGISSNPELVEIDDVFLPILCRAILRERKEVAQRIETPRQATLSQEIIDKLQSQLLRVDKFLSLPWFSKEKAMRLPRIADYLTVQESERTAQQVFPPRDYDEKFHVLMAPRLFHEDLKYFREKCSIRGAPISVGYVDIDNFKSFNTEYSEPVVDRNLLPKIMQIFEAHVFSRGYAYRYGGDEYIFLLPNTDEEDGKVFFDNLRNRVKTAIFPKIASNPTLSIGLFSFDPDSIFTERELEEKANQLKNEAKSRGKDQVVTGKE